MERESTAMNGGFLARPMPLLGAAMRPRLSCIQFQQRMQEFPMSESSPTDLRQANGRFAKGHPGGPGRPRNPVSTMAGELDRRGVDVAEELMAMTIEKARKG